jgi:hypothetical protein
MEHLAPATKRLAGVVAIAAGSAVLHALVIGAVTGTGSAVRPGVAPAPEAARTLSVRLVTVRPDRSPDRVPPDSVPAPASVAAEASPVALPPFGATRPALRPAAAVSISRAPPDGSTSRTSKSAAPSPKSAARPSTRVHADRAADRGLQAVLRGSAAAGGVAKDASARPRPGDRTAELDATIPTAASASASASRLDSGGQSGPGASPLGAPPNDVAVDSRDFDPTDFAAVSDPRASAKAAGQAAPEGMLLADADAEADADADADAEADAEPSGRDVRPARDPAGPSGPVRASDAVGDAAPDAWRAADAKAAVSRASPGSSEGAVPTPASASAPSAAMDVSPASAPPAAADDPRAPLPSLPGSRSQRFRVYWGDFTEQRSVARLHYRLTHDGERYEIRTEAEAEGLISLVYAGTLVQVSSGRLGPEGLEPLRYAEQRGKRSERVVSFDPDGGRLLPQGGAAPVDLPPGTQDRLSVFYQIGLVARGDPAGFAAGTSREMPVASLRAVERQRFEVIGDEVLMAPGGPLRTLHLRRPSPSDRDDPSIDVWLGYDFDMLPVRLRIEDIGRRVLDQIIDRGG